MFEAMSRGIVGALVGPGIEPEPSVVNRPKIESRLTTELAEQGTSVRSGIGRGFGLISESLRERAV